MPPASENTGNTEDLSEVATVNMHNNGEKPNGRNPDGGTPGADAILAGLNVHGHGGHGGMGHHAGAGMGGMMGAPPAHGAGGYGYGALCFALNTHTSRRW